MSWLDGHADNIIPTCFIQMTVAKKGLLICYSKSVTIYNKIRKNHQYLFIIKTIVLAY